MMISTKRTKGYTMPVMICSVSPNAKRLNVLVPGLEPTDIKGNPPQLAGCAPTTFLHFL